jgi:single-strand DNA-binding protein
VEGRLRSRSFDAKDGTKRHITEIQVDNMVLLGGRKEGGSEYQSSSYQQIQAPAPSPSLQQPQEDITLQAEDNKEDKSF